MLDNTSIKFPEKWMSARDIGKVIKLSKLAVVTTLREINAQKRWVDNVRQAKWEYNTDDYTKYIEELNK